MRWLLVMANIPGSLILVTLMMEALGSSEMSVPTRATLRNIPEDDLLHSHCHENLKSYMNKEDWLKLLKKAGNDGDVGLDVFSAVVSSSMLHNGFLLGSLSTLKMEVIDSSEMLVCIMSTWHHITEDGRIDDYFILTCNAMPLPSLNTNCIMLLM
jgi:hypothetical protein